MLAPVRSGSSAREAKAAAAVAIAGRVAVAIRGPRVAGVGVPRPTGIHGDAFQRSIRRTQQLRVG